MVLHASVLDSPRKGQLPFDVSLMHAYSPSSYFNVVKSLFITTPKPILAHVRYEDLVESWPSVVDGLRPCGRHERRARVRIRLLQGTEGRMSREM